MGATYDVTVTREDNLWVAVVRQLMPGATDVEHFADLDTEVRDLVAGLTDSDPGNFDLHWHYEFNDQDVTDALVRLRNIAAHLAATQADYEQARLGALRALNEAGLSRRAMADAVGLSHQRVQQLLAS